jgi:inorganic pyrophosphatase
MKLRKWLIVALLGGTIPLASAENETLNAASVKQIDDYTLQGERSFFNGYEPGDAEGNANVVVEIPKGSTGKWEVSGESGNIIWEFKKGKPRIVDYRGGYPANYGSIPKTSMPATFGGDGESLDVIVLGDAIPRGEVVTVRLVGVLNLQEGDEFDAKILAVRKGSPEDSAADLAALNTQFNGIVDTVKEWFTNYKGADSGVEIKSIGDAANAMEILMVSAEAFAAR